MPIKTTKFKISKKPGPMGLMVETTSFTIYSSGKLWIAEESVNYRDDTVDVIIVIRGQTGEEYKMIMTLNSVKKTIEGTLKKDGKNKIIRKYKLSSFNL